MVNEKIIEIITNLKEKRLSDVEITDILLQNNFNITEIKENLNEYNNQHGISNNYYLDKYKDIQESVKKIEYFDKKKETTKKVTNSKNFSKTIFYIIFILVIISILIMGYIYVKNTPKLNNNLDDTNQDLEDTNNIDDNFENTDNTNDTNDNLEDTNNETNEINIENLTSYEFKDTKKEFILINTKNYSYQGTVNFNDELIDNKQSIELTLNIKKKVSSENELQSSKDEILNDFEDLKKLIPLAYVYPDQNFNEFNSVDIFNIPEKYRYKYIILNKIFEQKLIKETPEDLKKISTIILDSNYNLNILTINYDVEIAYNTNNIYSASFYNSQEIIQITLFNENVNPEILAYSYKQIFN